MSERTSKFPILDILAGSCDVEASESPARLTEAANAFEAQASRSEAFTFLGVVSRDDEFGGGKEVRFYLLERPGLSLKDKKRAAGTTLLFHRLSAALEPEVTATLHLARPPECSREQLASRLDELQEHAGFEMIYQTDFV